MKKILFLFLISFAFLSCSNNNQTADISFSFSRNIIENQEILTLLDAADEYFKQNVPINDRTKIKGLKMDLITIKNVIVKASQKRNDYCAHIEEQQQMRKLGITNV